MTVKERLIKFLTYKQIGQKKFAESVLLSAGYVNAIRNSIQPDKIAKIAEQYPELNTGWLLTGEGEMLKNDKASTSLGTPIYSNLDNLSVIGYIDIPDVDKNQLVVQYNGGSMLPAIERGNYLAIKPSSGEFMLWGHIYLVITDEFSVVGRIHQLSEDSIIIKFDNHDYADFSIPRSCIIKTYIIDSVISIKKLI